MKGSRKSQEDRPKKMMLTEIEKLDGKYPGVLFQTKAYLDQGASPQEIADHINDSFGTSICNSTVSNFRAKRWLPEREFTALKVVTTKAAIEAFGGDAGLDAVILAKLWELMDKMTIPQLISARTLFVRVRAQNLKEQEFLYKTGQLKPGQTEEQDADPQAQQKKVLRRIKEIFGLAGDEEPEPEKVDVPAAAGNPSG